MPQFEFTFTDTTTLAVNSPTAAEALSHVRDLLTVAKHTDQNPELKGKALASETPKTLKK